MAKVPGRNRCVTCDKEKATLRCGGCLQEFCFNHSTDHRQELSKQLDDIEVSRDLFRQTLIDQTTDSHKHGLIEQINDWEHDSIKKIQQVAKEAKQKLLKHTTEHIKQMEVDLNKLTDELRQSREENDFYETDIRHWNEELTRLAKELPKPSNIILRRNSTSLINDISVDIISGECTSIINIFNKIL